MNFKKSINLINKLETIELRSKVVFIESKESDLENKLRIIEVRNKTINDR